MKRDVDKFFVYRRFIKRDDSRIEVLARRREDLWPRYRKRLVLGITEGFKRHCATKGERQGVVEDGVEETISSDACPNVIPSH